MRGSVEEENRGSVKITNNEIDTIEFPFFHMVLTVSLLPVICYVIFGFIIAMLVHFELPLINSESPDPDWRDILFTAIVLVIVYHIWNITTIIRTVTVNKNSIVVNGLELMDFPKMRFSSHWFDNEGSIATPTYLVFGLRAYYAGPVASDRCKQARKRLEYALKKAGALSGGTAEEK
jgi:hypothetical protein